MGRKTGALNHTHKYYRLEGLWFCGSPGCTHFMPKNMPPPVYKMSICWTCRLPMELNPDNMQSTHPVHARCEPFVYTPPELAQEPEGESMEEYIERQLREARMKKYKPESEPEPTDKIESEVVHMADCASWAGSACDCGAES